MWCYAGARSLYDVLQEEAGVAQHLKGEDKTDIRDITTKLRVSTRVNLAFVEQWKHTAINLDDHFLGLQLGS